MNRLQSKVLLLSVITEVKFGQPLAPNAIGIKNEFKALVGLPKNATNVNVLKELKRTYIDNGLKADIDRIEAKFNITL